MEQQILHVVHQVLHREVEPQTRLLDYLDDVKSLVEAVWSKLNE